ncbi:MAG: O-antigen ligase family protein [Oscillospiraceae bacterium]|nr:O-antigen ligase family protein [Oscillospiraceae bacterium]
MAKTIFGTSDKSNFILNMDLDKFRSACGEIAMIIFWSTALSQLMSHMLGSAEMGLSEIANSGGLAGVLVFLLLLVRRTSVIFSLAAVFALFATAIGLMRKQFSKATAAPYLLLSGSLIWAMISRFHSYDLRTSLLGYSGHEEGWFALLMYAGIFYLGTMVRGKADRERFVRRLMGFGIAQGVVGLIQALPFVDYIDPSKGLNPYRNIDPLLYWNVRLPAGMTDSPINYAMMLGMVGAAAVPAAMLSEEKKTRVLAKICLFLSVVMSLKTQTVAGLIAGFGLLLLTLIMAVAKRKTAFSKAAPCVLTFAAVILAAGWIYASPRINQTYFHPDRTELSDKRWPKGIMVRGWEDDVSDVVLENAFVFDKNTDGKTYPALYDGGIVWDNGYYRLFNIGAYTPFKEHDFEIYDAFSVLRYCWEQGVRAVKIDPLLGVGPDNFVYTQLKTSYDISGNPNSVDAPYNEYLYIAGTRGIPSLLMHLALVVCCFVLAWKRRKNGSSWIRLSACCAAVLYLLTAIVGTSVLTVVPVFFALLGLTAADPLAETEKAAAPADPEKAEKKNKKDKKAK